MASEKGDLILERVLKGLDAYALVVLVTQGPQGNTVKAGAAGQTRFVGEGEGGFVMDESRG